MTARLPSSDRPSPALGFTVPDELVELLAQRTAELVAARVDAADSAAALRSTDRLALTKTEAAEALGVSVDHLDRHVLPGLRIVRSGRLRLIPVDELAGWLERSASRALEGNG